ELLVFHPPAPVRIAVGEAAVGGDHVQLVVAEQLEDGLEEVQPEPAGVPLDLLLHLCQAGREALRHQRPFPRKSRIDWEMASLSAISERATFSESPTVSRRSLMNWPEP